MARDWSKLGTEAWGSKEGIVFQEGVLGGEVLNCVGDLWATPEEIIQADFIALAKNAFGVMVRRRSWYPLQTCYEDEPASGKWMVCSRSNAPDFNCPNIMARFGRTAQERLMLWDDPFSALVEADKWYKENVEKETAVR